MLNKIDFAIETPLYFDLNCIADIIELPRIDYFIYDELYSTESFTVLINRLPPFQLPEHLTGSATALTSPLSFTDKYTELTYRLDRTK
jgi:hypothetical protein